MRKDPSQPNPTHLFGSGTRVVIRLSIDYISIMSMFIGCKKQCTAQKAYNHPQLLLFAIFYLSSVMQSHARTSLTAR